MASPDQRRLWELGKIDRALLQIRQRLANLDIGGKIAAEIQVLKAKDAEIGGEAKALHAEQRDIELRQKSLQDKIAKIDKELYTHKIMSAREVENLEKEKGALRRQIERDDERLLELFDIVPPAQEAAKKTAAAIEQAEVRLTERQERAKQEKVLLEQEFARLTALRPEKAKIVPAPMLARYDMVRQKSNGIGMVEVLGTSCGGCGTNLPERTLQALREDKLATCEACHRLLYFTEGVV